MIQIKKKIIKDEYIVHLNTRQSSMEYAFVLRTFSITQVISSKCQFKLKLSFKNKERLKNRERT